MSSLTLLAICVQACLLQSVLSVGCGSLLNLGGISLSSNSIATSRPISIPSSISSSNSGSGYGGIGTGTVSAAGPISADGTTCVTGAVPVIGEVSFSGIVPAYGTVAITGQCGCGK